MAQQVGYLNRAQRRSIGVRQQVGDDKAVVILQSALQKTALRFFILGAGFGIPIGAIILTVVLKVLV